MKQTLLINTLIISVLLIGCAEKKKQYIPLVGLVQDSGNSANTAGSSNIAASSTSQASSTTEVTLVAGGSNSDVNQTTSTSSSSAVPVVSVTGNTGTISSSATSSNSSTTSASTVASSSSDVSSSSSNSASSTSSSSSSSTNTTTAQESTNTTSAASTTNSDTTNVTSTSTTTSTTSSGKSLDTVQPSVTVSMDSSALSSVPLLGLVVDSKGNTIGGSSISIVGTTSTGQTTIIYNGSSSASGNVSGSLQIPSNVTSLTLTLSISNKNAIPVIIPVSIAAVCKEDNNRGHGNDADGIDEDNTGNSTGVNQNAMDNRQSKDKQATCKSETKYLSKLGNITLPVEASQLALLKEQSSNLMAYINGTDSDNTFIALIIIIILAASGIALRRKFITT